MNCKYNILIILGLLLGFNCGTIKQSNYLIVYHIYTYKFHSINEGNCYNYKRNTKPLCSLEFELKINTTDESIPPSNFRISNDKYEKQNPDILKGTILTNSIPKKVWVYINLTGHHLNENRSRSFSLELFEDIKLKLYRFPDIKRIYVMKGGRSVFRIGLTITHTCADKYFGKKCTNYCDSSVSSSRCKEHQQSRCIRRCGKNGVCRYKSYYKRNQFCKCDKGFYGMYCRYFKQTKASTTLPIVTKPFKLEDVTDSNNSTTTETKELTKYSMENIKSSEFTKTVATLPTKHKEESRDTTNEPTSTIYKETISKSISSTNTNTNPPSKTEIPMTIIKNYESENSKSTIFVSKPKPLQIKSKFYMKSTTENKILEPIKFKLPKVQITNENNHQNLLRFQALKPKTTVEPSYESKTITNWLLKKKANSKDRPRSNDRYTIKETRIIENKNKMKIEEYWALNFRLFTILLFILICIILLVVLYISHKWYKLMLSASRSTNNYYFEIANNKQYSKINKDWSNLSQLTKLIEEMQEKFEKPNMDLKTFI